MKQVYFTAQKHKRPSGPPKKRAGKLSWVHMVELHDNDEGKRPKHDPLSPH